jgi:hypothetical protein
MAHYLVTATPKADRLLELAARLFLQLPFGRALTRSFRAACSLDGRQLPLSAIGGAAERDDLPACRRQKCREPP